MNDSYNCTICHETLIEPSVLGCGHTYCTPCINSLQIKRCPLDNKPFKSIAINYTLKSIIDDLYKDDVEYQKRIKSIELKKTYDVNLKHLHAHPEFRAAYEKIVHEIDDNYIQLLATEEEFGKVLTWTSLDKALKEEGDPIRTFGNYVFVIKDNFIKDHHEEMSKSDIVSLIIPEKVPNQQIRKMIDAVFGSDSFMQEFNAYIESIKPNIEKNNAIRELHKKIGYIESTQALRDKLMSSSGRDDINKLLNLMDISTSMCSDRGPDGVARSSWSRQYKKYEGVYEEYRNQIRRFDEDLEEVEESDQSDI